MLVADGVAQLEGSASDVFGGETHEAVELDDHHLVHLHIDHQCPMSLGIIVEYVAIGEPLSACKRNGILLTTIALGHQAALLCRPLIE